MKNFFRFRGWPARVVWLPLGQKIICTFCWDGTEPDESIYEANHNVFRLSAHDEVIWQVRRDDSNRPPDWWDRLDVYARRQGYDGARHPFNFLELKYPDGSTNRSPQTGCLPNEAVWTPDCTIWLTGSAYQQYLLDPETGIAKNVTEGSARPW